MNNEVAPITGAWIETTIAGVAFIHQDVAPITGAWIETGIRGRCFGG